MITEEIDIDTFRETVRNEISADNKFLAGWQPNPSIDDAVDLLELSNCCDLLTVNRGN
jgi:hypothetical protein